MCWKAWVLGKQASPWPCHQTVPGLELTAITMDKEWYGFWWHVHFAIGPNRLCQPGVLGFLNTCPKSLALSSCKNVFKGLWIKKPLSLLKRTWGSSTGTSSVAALWDSLGLGVFHCDFHWVSLCYFRLFAQQCYHVSVAISSLFLEISTFGQIHNLWMFASTQESNV